MLLSKTFAYALRSILFLALVHEENRFVQISEIADKLKIPKHFLAKVLQLISKKGILDSVKGPNGGFKLSDKSMKTKLIEIMQITDAEGVQSFYHCVLHFQNCNLENPCPLHKQVKEFRENFMNELSIMSISDLLKIENITSSGK